MARRNLDPSVRLRAQALKEEGLGTSEIAQRVGVSTSTVHRWLGTSAILLKVERDRVEAQRLRTEEKLSNSQISERMGVDYRTVWRWLGPQPRSYRLEPKNKLPTKVRKEAMRLRKEEGLSNPEIAERIGVSLSTVWVWLGSTPPHLMAKPRRDYSRTHFHSRAFYLRECGYNIREIAEIMDVPSSTIGGWLKGYGCFGRATD